MKQVLLIVASHTLKKMCAILTSALGTTSERTLTSESKGDTVRWFDAAIASVSLALVMNSVPSSSKFRWLIVSFIWKLGGPRRTKLVVKIKLEDHTCLVFRLVSSTSNQDSDIAER